MYFAVAVNGLPDAKGVEDMLSHLHIPSLKSGVGVGTRVGVVVGADVGVDDGGTAVGVTLGVDVGVGVFVGGTGVGLGLTWHVFPPPVLGKHSVQLSGPSAHSDESSQVLLHTFALVGVGVGVEVETGIVGVLEGTDWQVPDEPFPTQVEQFNGHCEFEVHGPLHTGGVSGGEHLQLVGKGFVLLQIKWLGAEEYSQ